MLQKTPLHKKNLLFDEREAGKPARKVRLVATTPKPSSPPQFMSVEKFLESLLQFQPNSSADEIPLLSSCIATPFYDINVPKFVETLGTLIAKQLNISVDTTPCIFQNATVLNFIKTLITPIAVLRETYKPVVFMQELRTFEAKEKYIFARIRAFQIQVVLIMVYETFKPVEGEKTETSTSPQKKRVSNGRDPLKKKQRLYLAELFRVISFHFDLPHASMEHAADTRWSKLLPLQPYELRQFLKDTLCRYTPFVKTLPLTIQAIFKLLGQDPPQRVQTKPTTEVKRNLPDLSAIAPKAPASSSLQVDKKPSPTTPKTPEDNLLQGVLKMPGVSVIYLKQYEKKRVRKSTLTGKKRSRETDSSSGDNQTTASEDSSSATTSTESEPEPTITRNFVQLKHNPKRRKRTHETTA